SKLTCSKSPYGCDVPHYYLATKDSVPHAKPDVQTLRMDAIRASNQPVEPYSLLTLPLEVREQIYGYLIHQGDRQPKIHVEISTFDD
ncbi:hypothetical protein JMJ77_0008296, partial [Colletotrichum scovillei]